MVCFLVKEIVPDGISGEKAPFGPGFLGPGLRRQRRITVSIRGWHVGSLCTRRGTYLPWLLEPEVLVESRS